MYRIQRLPYRLISLLLLALGLALSACGGAGADRTRGTATVTPPAEATTPISAATPFPTNTVAPATAEAATPTSVGVTPVADVGQNACDHPYFPLRRGATWTYRTRPEGITMRWEVTEVTGDQQTATARMRAVVVGQDQAAEEGVQLEYTWQCKAGGGVVSFDYVSLSSMESSESLFTAKVAEVQGEGVMFPPVEQMKPGATWNLKVTSRIEVNVPDIEWPPGTIDTQATYTVLEARPVTFGGTPYDGLVIREERQMTFTMTMSDVNVDLPPTQFSLTTEAILARGIGYVESRTVDQTGEQGMELVEFRVP